jgi:transcriptional regulator with PAS, ATPase and Fis domain
LLALQPKLLRVLESREARRVGSNVAQRLDVRVLAATHRQLARSVNEGTFREDLYYRLAVVEIELPPLRARREDIPQLAGEFFAKLTGRAEVLPPDLSMALMARAWPGNVRELGTSSNAPYASNGPAARAAALRLLLAPATLACVRVVVPGSRRRRPVAGAHVRK